MEDLSGSFGDDGGSESTNSSPICRKVSDLEHEPGHGFISNVDKISEQVDLQNETMDFVRRTSCLEQEAGSPRRNTGKDQDTH